MSGAEPTYAQKAARSMVSHWGYYKARELAQKHRGDSPAPSLTYWDQVLAELRTLGDTARTMPHKLFY